MAALDQFLGSGSLWLIGLLFLVALVAACLLGRMLRLRVDRSGPASGTEETYLLSAALGLLGLLIAFTFSLAVERFDARRDAVVREGNALSTLWLRAELVDGAPGEALRSAIRSYATWRDRLPTAPDLALIEARSAGAQNEVWAGVRSALPTLPPPIGATLVNAANEAFDAASARKAERSARIPVRILNVVSLYAAISAAIIGYVTGRRADRRHVVEALVLFLLLTLALTLILDLDRPWSGGITVSAEPVREARAAMG